MILLIMFSECVQWFNISLANSTLNETPPTQLLSDFVNTIKEMCAMIKYFASKVKPKESVIN